MHYIFNPHNYPRKRAAIACEICRVRKTRCDATKPSCASCVELGVVCSYRKLVPDSRPEQDTAGIFLSKIESRLAGIEARLDGNYKNWLDPSNAATFSPKTPRSSSPLGSSATSHETYIGFQRLGLSFDIFKLLGHNRLPPALEPLSVYGGEPFVEQEIVKGTLLNQTGDPNTLDLSPQACLELQQSFAENILPWFPLFNREAFSKRTTQFHDCAFNQSDQETCQILFILGLGALSRAKDFATDDARNFPGLNYFLAACRILNPTPNYSLVEVQCYILKSMYLSLCIRPLQAAHAISIASRSVLTLLNLHSRLDKDAQLRESCHRAYWVCFILENELGAYVMYGILPLSSVNKHIPLPLSSYDEPDMFWFLAEISMQRLYLYALEMLWKEPGVQCSPKVIEILRQQITIWYDGLPANVIFPEEFTTPLDPQRAFLRGQYFGLRMIINWPAVLTLLTEAPDDEKQGAELLRLSSQAIHYAIAHVMSAESLLQERHPLVPANLLWTYYSTMILLIIHGASVFAPIYNPAITPTILKGHAMLSAWTTDPGVAKTIRPIEALMVQKGLLADKKSVQSASIAPTSTPGPGALLGMRIVRS